MIDHILYIQRLVAAWFGVPVDKLIRTGRFRAIVEPRYVAITLIKRYCCVTLEMIGCFFDNKDHSTILHSLVRCQELMDTDKNYRSDYKTLDNIFKTQFNLRIVDNKVYQ